MGLAAEPRYGQCGAGGAAASDSDELACANFGVRHRKCANAKDLIESRNTGAKNIRHLRKDPARPQAMPG